MNVAEEPVLNLDMTINGFHITDTLECHNVNESYQICKRLTIVVEHIETRIKFRWIEEFSSPPFMRFEENYKRKLYEVLVPGIVEACTIKHEDLPLHINKEYNPIFSDLIKHRLRCNI